jgi:signal transduction histidine kinase
VVEADALQMEQLFQNLLSNALKFRRPDVPLEIRIESRVGESFCEILVVDNGIGFEEKYSERIFMVFERLHGRDKYPGTGVGLAICRRIMERHGGYISAQGKPGEGAIFTMGFPQPQSLPSPQASGQL